LVTQLPDDQSPTKAIGKEHHEIQESASPSSEAVTAGPDLVLLATAMARARQLIRQHIRKHGAATASDLRQALNTNRRVIIPLLEQFDRDGFTVRHGDRRGLRDGGQ
jgi:hypothetical protein